MDVIRNDRKKPEEATSADVGANAVTPDTPAKNSAECGDSSCTKTSCAGCPKNTAAASKTQTDATAENEGRTPVSKSKSGPESFKEKTNDYNDINRVIAVVSGKGGVGKSLVTAMLAILLRRKGYNVGILDADITGPSIPKMFGVTKKAEASELGIFPERTNNDIKIMSINLLLQQVDSPVIWRGPLLASAVKQFWTDVLWGELDFLFIDMPPGTGDVPLTVFQSIAPDGIVIVTSPQELVSMIVRKAYNMAKQMNVPVLGIVENMSYVKCPGCGTEIPLFGKSDIENISKQLNVPLLGRLPIDPEISALVDKGMVERFDNGDLDDGAAEIEKLLSAEIG